MRIKVNEKIYNFLEQAKAREVIIYGGAGAGKSYAIAQYLIFDKLFTEKNIRIGIIRKTMTSNRDSAYKLVVEMLSEMHIPYDLQKQAATIRLNRNEIVFRGLDDPEKIKSTEYNYIWIEETTDLNIADYRQLQLRLRRHNENGPNQIYMSFNPVDEFGWLKKDYFQTETDADILHVNYLDNPFLDKDYIVQLKDFEEIDKSYWEIYGLGNWTKVAGHILQNYTIVPRANIPEKFPTSIAGLDFGYVHPSVLLKIGIKENCVYITREIYRTHMTNRDLLDAFPKFFMGNKKTIAIYADSAEPARIKEIADAGYNIFPAKKSVSNGLDCLQRMKIIISDSCVNTTKEIRNYKYKQLRNGEFIDEPVKIADHAMDALRYAVFSYLDYGVATGNLSFAASSNNEYKGITI